MTPVTTVTARAASADELTEQDMPSDELVWTLRTLRAALMVHLGAALVMAAQAAYPALRRIMSS